MRNTPVIRREQNDLVEHGDLRLVIMLGATVRNG